MKISKNAETVLFSKVAFSIKDAFNNAAADKFKAAYNEALRELLEGDVMSHVLTPAGLERGAFRWLVRCDGYSRVFVPGHDTAHDYKKVEIIPACVRLFLGDSSNNEYFWLNSQALLKYVLCPDDIRDVVEVLRHTVFKWDYDEPYNATATLECPYFKDSYKMYKPAHVEGLSLEQFDHYVVKDNALFSVVAFIGRLFFNWVKVMNKTTENLSWNYRKQVKEIEINQETAKRLGFHIDGRGSLQAIKW